MAVKKASSAQTTAESQRNEAREEYFIFSQRRGETGAGRWWVFVMKNISREISLPWE